MYSHRVTRERDQRKEEAREEECELAQVRGGMNTDPRDSIVR